MQRKLLACLLAIVMVLGMCGLAAAAPKKDVGPDWKQVQGTEEIVVTNDENDEGEGEEGEEEPELGRQHPFKEKLIGPPAFVMEKHETKIKLKGKPFETDLPPVLKGGRMLIPLRAISNGLKADLEWIAEEQKITITKDETVIIIFLGKMTYTVDEEEMKFDVGPELISNRTFVPLRFIAEALGLRVNYENGEVTIDCECGHECGEECENCLHKCGEDCMDCVHECDDDCECGHECDEDCEKCVHECDDNCVECVHECDED